MASVEVRSRQAFATDRVAPSPPQVAVEGVRVRADAVASVAAAHADAVDREARFPREAVALLKDKRLMGLAVPRDLGGEGAGPSEVADVCYRLGRACSATAMIFAMHQIKVACVCRHGVDSAWHARMLRRLCAEQWLLASSTTEGHNGGNVRASDAAVGHAGHRITLDRDATVISYGAEADGIVTTARREADAAHSDQVLVVLLRGDYTLERGQSWDTLGMRGTCSTGFKLTADAERAQILPVPYDKIHAHTMTPSAHVFWSGAWAGIAAAAVARAQAFTRVAARRNKGQLPPGASHLTRAQASLRSLRDLVAAAARRYERALGDEAALGSLEFQTNMTLLKVESSELAVATVLACLRACGLSGYRNDGEASMGRLLRDVLSSPLMINNDRILASLGLSALMAGVPDSLVD